jgi:hypothetical protein
MSHLGFGQKWRNWISVLWCTSSSIIPNGEHGRKIPMCPHLGFGQKWRNWISALWCTSTLCCFFWQWSLCTCCSRRPKRSICCKILVQHLMHSGCHFMLMMQQFLFIPMCMIFKSLTISYRCLLMLVVYTPTWPKLNIFLFNVKELIWSL